MEKPGSSLDYLKKRFEDLPFGWKRRSYNWDYGGASRACASCRESFLKGRTVEIVCKGTWLRNLAGDLHDFQLFHPQCAAASSLAGTQCTSREDAERCMRCGQDFSPGQSIRVIANGTWSKPMRSPRSFVRGFHTLRIAHVGCPS